MSDNDKINDRIRLIRTAKGMRQGPFARLVGYSQARISEIEAGVVSVSERHIDLICAKTGARTEWLRHGTGEMFVDNQAPPSRVKTAPEEMIDFDIDEVSNLNGDTFQEVDTRPEQGQAVRMLLDIFESGDQKAVDAIYKNLEYFSSAARRGAADRRKATDLNWPAEKERRQGGAGPKAPQG